jgi:hypothetical protein
MLRSVSSVDSTHVGSFDTKDSMSTRSPSAQENTTQKDSEGLIPVISADSEIYYILDCPDLHLVSGRQLFPEGSFLGENVYFCLLLVASKLTLIRSTVRSRNTIEAGPMPPVFWLLQKGEKNTCRIYCSTPHYKSRSLDK